jgi:hypothetical protein
MIQDTIKIIKQSMCYNRFDQYIAQKRKRIIEVDTMGQN